MPRVDVAFEAAVLDGLGRLLLDDNDLCAAAAALGAAAPRLDEIPAIAKKHKVTTIVAANADLLAASNAGLPEAIALQQLLAPDLEAARRHRALLEAELSALSSPLTNGAVVIKGLSSARHYPQPYVRWMRDLDLLCRSWTDALALLEQLIANGYRYDAAEAPWIKADPDRDRDLYGQIFLIRAAADDFCRIDIHFGTYSVGYSGYLDVDWSALSVSATVAGVDVLVLRPEGALLVALAHALSDGYVAAKDVNDFAASALSATDLNWELAGREIRRHRLEPQARLLARHCLALYSDSRVVDAANRLARCCVGARVASWRTHDRSWARRASVNAQFTFRWHRGRDETLRLAAWRSMQCYLFYRRRLSLAVRRRSLREAMLHKLMRRPCLREWQLRPDTCTMLVDAQAVRAASPRRSAAQQAKGGAATTAQVAVGIDVITAGGYDFLRLQGRLFVPTADALITPAQAAAVPGG